jgi:hypothetical protein
MKEESDVMRENMRMKNNEQNLWVKKKKQQKLQDEDQWHFCTNMKWCMVGEQHYAMMGFRTLARTLTFGLNTSVC